MRDREAVDHRVVAAVFDVRIARFRPLIRGDGKPVRRDLDAGDVLPLVLLSAGLEVQKIVDLAAVLVKLQTHRAGRHKGRCCPDLRLFPVSVHGRAEIVVDMSVEEQIDVQLLAHLFKERRRRVVLLHQSRVREHDAVRTAGRIEHFLCPRLFLLVEVQLVLRRVRTVDPRVRLVFRMTKQTSPTTNDAVVSCSISSSMPFGRFVRPLKCE